MKTYDTFSEIYTWSFLIAYAPYIMAFISVEGCEVEKLEIMI